MRTFVVVVMLLALVGCAPSCVVYQNQQQGCPAPQEAAQKP